IVQLLILSYAATLDVTSATIGILNKDMGKPSFELIERFIGSKTFKKIYYLNNESQLKEMIDQQKIMAAIHIDSQFSKNVLQKKPASFQLILDGRKSNTTQILQGYILQILNQYNLDYIYDQPPVIETELIPRNWYNPNLIYTWFTVPGLIGILSMVICIMLTSLSVSRERELGTFDQLLVSPLSPLEILIGKTVPAVILAMVEASLILLSGLFIFKIPFHGSFLGLYLGMFSFILSVLGIGLFLSSICKTQQQSLLTSFIFISPSIILSGYATPIETMPVWLQRATVFNPMKYYLIIIRGSFLKQLPFSEILLNTYPLLLIAFFNLLFSYWFFKRRLD
ncbi:MAG: ABC transporter permease, partial [Chlamydiae bacterium]|nr:ABC transporter permease [Chlamydiota bacterium]